MLNGRHRIHVAFQTYSIDKQVPDAASSATAMFTGVKVKQRVIGLDANYKFNDTTHCDPVQSRRSGRLHSLATWAQEAGKSTGKLTYYTIYVKKVVVKQLGGGGVQNRPHNMETIKTFLQKFKNTLIF